MADSIYGTSDAVVYNTAANVASSRPLPQTSASAATGVTQPSDNVYDQIASSAKDGSTKNAHIALASAILGVLVVALVALGISAYALNSLKSAETEIVVLKSALARSEEETASLIASLKAAQETSDAKLANVTEAHQTVLFTAKNTDTVDVIENIPIIFPNVQTNLGGGYNRSSGIFTAPHSGSYLLTTNVCAWQSKAVIVQLVAAGTAIAATEKYNAEYYGTCTSISGVAVLREGDTASVRGTFSLTRAMWIGGTYRWPSFAGMLVHKT